MANGFSAFILAVVSTMLAGALAGLPASSSQPAPGGDIQPAPGGSREWQAVASEEQPTEFPAVPSLPEPGEWWEDELSVEYFQEATVEKYLTKTAEPPYFWLYDDTAKLARIARRLFTRTEQQENFSLALLIENSEETQEEEALGQRILPNLFFDLVRVDDIRYTGTFYENGVKLTRAFAGEASKDWKNVLLEPESYALLQQKVQELTEDNRRMLPSWLCMMHRSRMVKVTVTGTTGQSAVYLSPGYISPGYNAIFLEDICPNVEGPGVSTHQTSLPDAAQVEIEFNNGLVFRIFYTENQVLVTTNDTEFGLLYQTWDYTFAINHYAANQGTLRTG